MITARRLVAVALLAAAAGCQQRMAEQPYYRPYEPTDFFPDGRSNRPLEPGTMHRGQLTDADPLATGLTRGEWGRFWKRGENPPKVDAAAGTGPEDRETAYGAPRFDPPRVADPTVAGGFRPFTPGPGTVAHPGPAIYADEFPFTITAADLSRGGERYTAYCAMCHGPLGNGKGKIWERGYLKPSSYHTEPVEPNEAGEYGQIPRGYSRGYWKWDIHIPLREVPVGYYFEVITKGYGAMGNYSAQIHPDDRWRIIAYIRTLQMSQRAEPGRLPAELLQKVNAGGSQ